MINNNSHWNNNNWSVLKTNKSNNNKVHHMQRKSIFDGIRDEEKIEKSKWGYKVLENLYFIILWAFLTLFALFGDYFRIIISNEDDPILFNILTIITILFFSVELIINIFTKYKYVFSFMFFLDLIATIMLLFDITYISNIVFKTSEFNNSVSEVTSTLKFFARAGRIIRVVNLFNSAENFQARRNKKSNKKKEEIINNNMKASKNLKLLKSLSQLALENEPENQKVIQRSLKKVDINYETKNLKILMNKAEMDSNKKILRESKVGKKLNELTIKRVILLMLLILIGIPLFSVEFYSKPYYAGINDISTIEQLINNNYPTTEFNLYIENLKNKYVDNNLEIIGIDLINNYQNFTSSNINNFRSDEINLYINPNDTRIKMAVSYRFFIKLDAILNIIETIFSIFLLVIMSYLFNRDAKQLILIPIERMIRKVNNMAINPIEALEYNEINKNKVENYETYQVELAINKINMLLILGYGQAGSEIISSTLFSEGDLNPNLPGIRKMAIFGFCDIRNFTDATEVLKSEVMRFVNRIAKIVHSVVDSFKGTANKNIGDAFLLIWKLDFHTEHNQETLEDIHPQTKKYADLSILSFLKIIAKVAISPDLYEYSLNEELNKRIPNYRVKMGFGLHVGWAIEGAIGSEFKIDASYLSPNVNMASRLEAATKQFGQYILISSELIKIASDNVKQICRQIDIVTVKGSIKPIGLYTVDINLNKNVISNRKISSKGKRHKSKKRTLINSIREPQKKTMNNLVNQFMKGNLGPYGDNELKDILDYDENFYNSFNRGFEKYISGEWADCKILMEKVMEIRQDVPTKIILNFIKSYNYLKPDNWDGYRELSEK